MIYDAWRIPILAHQWQREHPEAFGRITFEIEIPERHLRRLWWAPSPDLEAQPLWLIPDAFYQWLDNSLQPPIYRAWRTPSVSDCYCVTYDHDEWLFLMRPADIQPGKLTS